MAASQNGYAANDISRTQSWKIPGTSRAIRLRKGSPGALLVAWAAWFDKNVEDIDAGELDDWGYAERPIRGSTTTLSNHASGTAMDLNSTKHPLGVRNTFTPAQTAKIRAELKNYEGCIRWGGDYTGRPDEMHFEIVKDVATCDRVLAKLNKAPADVTPPEEDDMPFTDAQIRALVQAELEEYGQRLFGPGGSMGGLITKIDALDDKVDKLIAALPKVQDK
jgi:hypothetical protein